MMAKELRGCLSTYFSRLEKLADTHRELLQIAERPLQALKNQTEQFRLVTSKDVDNAEILMIEELRERLIFKILMGIENEMTILVDIMARFNHAIQDLKKRLTQLENVRSQVDITDPMAKELLNGTSHIPKLSLLMEWAVDGYRHFLEAYIGIREHLACVHYENEESVEDFVESFTVDKFQRARINRILMFTQFLINQK